MKNLLLLLLANCSNAQELIQLIGIDVIDPEFANSSWHLEFYDSENVVDQSNYIPYQTIGIYRKDDSIEIKFVDYLLIPTKKGFKYASLNVQETKLAPSELSSHPMLDGIELKKSITEPIFFDSKEEIKSFIKTSTPPLKDAIDVHFQRFSFVTPDFYSTSEFNTFRHQGPTGLNSDELLKIYSLDWDKSKISNVVTDYLNNSVNTDKEMEEDAEDEVYFDFSFKNNGVYIIPYTFIKHNNSRGYLEEGSVIENIELYREFNVKKAIGDSGIIFISPDESTKTVIKQNQISVCDNVSNKLLANYHHTFNKVVMSEYAIGKYTENWKTEFAYKPPQRIVMDVNPENIPENITVNGDLIIAKKWMDNNGENLLIVSSRGPIPEPEPISDEMGDEHYVELFGAQPVKEDLWQNDIRRYTIGLGYKFSPDIQIKAAYSDQEIITDSY